MTNFWDLPKPVRQQIYRLHLVRDTPISRDEHRSLAKHESGGRSYNNANGVPIFWTRRNTPNILAISNKADKEAAPIYYGENHFVFDKVVQAWSFANVTYPRHLRMVRRVTCTYSGTLAREGFQAISRMSGLQELYIRVNEGMMVRQTLNSRHETQCWSHQIPDEELTPQQQLCLLRYPAMSALMSISNIPHVEFTKTKDWNGDEVGGALPGGFLETKVLPRLKGTQPTTVRPVGLDDDSFAFLSLPPEVRNRIYSLLLRIDGKIHPSPRQPSSTQKKIANRAFPRPTPESALGLLAVNKQVNDEAYAIFYYCNAFEFYYPTQLHLFLLSIGEERKKYLRDLTLHYYNYKVGGIDIADLSFPLLKQLPGLRRLHIVLDTRVGKLIRSNYIFSSGSGWNIDNANPMLLPGMRVLFSLRGVADIKLRCGELDKELKEVKQDKEYPHFSAKSKKACVVRLAEVFEHFNKALEDAQKGLVNKKMLDDPEWHMKDVFPTIDDDADKMKKPCATSNYSR